MFWVHILKTFKRNWRYTYIMEHERDLITFQTNKAKQQQQQHQNNNKNKSTNAKIQ